MKALATVFVLVALVVTLAAGIKYLLITVALLIALLVLAAMLSALVK